MSFTPSENPITHPERESYTELRPFRFWCQKVLPLVYDDTLSYYELLCKVVDYLNKTMEDVDHMNTDMDTLYSNFQAFQEGTFRIYTELVTYVNNYFDNLNVQEEINTKLDEMVTDGTLSSLINPLIPDIVENWLDEHVTPTTPAIDNTLSISGAGADSKTVGDAFSKTYSSNSTYSEGDIVLYNGKLYVCVNNIVSAEAWNSNNWREVNTGERLKRIYDELNLTGTYITNDSTIWGYYNNGVHVTNYNRLTLNKTIPVKKDDEIIYDTDGLYCEIVIYENDLNGSQQTPLFDSRYGVHGKGVFVVPVNGYFITTMQNAETYPESTQPSSKYQYNYLFFIRSASNTEIINKIDAINKTDKLVSSKLIVGSVGGYFEESVFNGFGTRIKAPAVISNIIAKAQVNTQGTLYCEILDDNERVIATSECISNTVSQIFTFNDVSISTDYIWIRIYGDGTAIPRRANVTSVSDIVNRSEPYGMQHTDASGWVKTSSLQYMLPMEINALIRTNNVNVGNNHYFKTVKSAIDYCNSNPNFAWDIFINEGTYNIYEELGGDSWFSSISGGSNMRGLKLNDNINIIGLGNVLLTLKAPDNLANANNVPNVSVLELTETNNTIKNLKIEGKNIRYIIHDETENKKPNQIRYYENLELTHEGNIPNTWSSSVSWGCGFSSNSFIKFDNCKFNSGMLMHNNINQLPSKVIFNNCIFHRGTYAIALNKTGDAKCDVYFNNCEIDYMLRLNEGSEVWNIKGAGNSKNMSYVVVGETDYSEAFMQFSDVTFETTANENISIFNPVKLNSGNSGVVKASNSHEFIGLALNNASTGEKVRVKTKGMVDCYGRAIFGGGTLFGVSNGALVADQNTPVGMAYNVDGINQMYIF